MRTIDWTEIDFFDPEEFDDPEAPGSWIYMNPMTIHTLNDLRVRTGWKIVTHNRYGLRGCVCVRKAGHSATSLHYAKNPAGCSAVDWHFVTDADPRAQALAVLQSGFTGIGCYYDWQWNSLSLPVGFHTDMRRRPQLWTRVDGRYVYLLK